jgi:hypothetical protein
MGELSVNQLYSTLFGSQITTEELTWQEGNQIAHPIVNDETW